MNTKQSKQLYDLHSALIDDNERDSLPKLRSRTLSSPIDTRQSQSFQTPDQNVSFDQSPDFENTFSVPTRKLTSDESDQSKPKSRKRRKTEVAEPESVEARFQKIASEVFKRKEQFRKTRKPRVSSQETRQVPTRILQEIQQHTPNTSPVPLSKASNKQKQKPLIVHLQRITNDRDKRVKINTIDVLNSLVQDFEPKEYDSTRINESAAQQDFKNHVTNHLSTLSDMFASVNDVTQSIKQIQKQKDDLRQKIYDINQQHNQVGQELNQLRLNHKQTQEKQAKLQKIEHGLTKLKSKSHDSDLDTVVQHKLIKLNKITNPEIGIFLQLTLLNEKLDDIDQELD